MENESFEEIWRKSVERAAQEFSTGDPGTICGKYGVDEDEARLLDTLQGRIGLQLRVLQDRGMGVAYTLHFVKTHHEERHEVRTMDDWKSLLSEFDEAPNDVYDLNFIYYAVRAHSRTRGICTVAIGLI